MKITAAIFSDKGSNKLNEDSFCAFEDIFGVFDGASSLTKFTDEKGKTGGYLAAHLVAKRFGSNEDDLLDVAKNANQALKDSMLAQSIDVSQGVNRWSTTISVIKVHEDSFDWVHIGDSVIIVVKNDGSYYLPAKYHNHDVEVLQLVKGLSGQDISNLWEYQPFVDASTILQNNRNITYGVLDGSDDALKFITSGTESLENVKSILLLTDGCYLPQENPDGSEDFAGIVKIVQESGLSGLHTHIRTLQSEDPKLWKYPRFKQGDDFTAVAISF